MADALNDVGLHIETIEEAIRRLESLGMIDIQTRNELLSVWERYYAEKAAYNRKEVFDALDSAEHALLAVENEETKRNPLFPSRRMKKEQLRIANARIAGYRNCDRFNDVEEMRKAYFAYQDKVIKLNITDAKPLMYDSWMLAMAVDNGENGNG